MIICKFEHGNDALLRHATADVVVYDDQDRILLVRRADFLVEGGKLSLPGGYMDRDERVADTARREVLEESGYECGDLTLLTVTSDPARPGDDRQNITFVFIAQVAQLVGEPDHESAGVDWFSIDDLPPSDDIAFDHYAHIELWRRYREGAVTVPVIA